MTDEQRRAFASRAIAELWPGSPLSPHATAVEVLRWLQQRGWFTKAREADRLWALVEACIMDTAADRGVFVKYPPPEG